MNEPLVWILLLNYNRYLDTVECVESIKTISYKNYKILIIDNYSTDNSFQQLKNNFKDLEVISTNENLGYTGGINFGINYLKKYSPEFILILNNDTIVTKSFLENLVDALSNNDNAAAACGTILCEHDRDSIWYASGKIINWRGLAIHLNKGKKFSSLNINSNKKTEFITGCMILLKVEHLGRIGLEDNRFYMYLDDIEYSQRIRSKGLELLYVHNSIIYHKVEGEKESPFKLYYSVRNRLLLISTSFTGINKLVAKLYFLTIIMLKIIYWRFFNKLFYRAAVFGLVDYFKKNYNKGRGHIFYSKNK